MKTYPKSLIITIDGPSGSGKSTIASAIAQNIGGKKLDTGAIYRSFAYYVTNNSISFSDEDLLLREAEKFRCDFQEDGSILLNGEDISKQIRTPAISSKASEIAAIPVVRQGLLNLQRELASDGPTVCEGRDMGTVVFPDAKIKFFLTATPETRAKRRYLELRSNGADSVTFEQILKQQIERDLRDSNRSIAPLKQPKDAIVIDSENKSIEEVTEFCISQIDKQLKR